MLHIKIGHHFQIAKVCNLNLWSGEWVAAGICDLSFYIYFWNIECNSNIRYTPVGSVGNEKNSKHRFKKLNTKSKANWQQTGVGNVNLHGNAKNYARHKLENQAREIQPARFGRAKTI